MKYRIPRPSPAMFVAILALVIATSGSAVAVTATLHSGDSLISYRSLSANRLRTNTLTGVEIHESTLAEVPHAAAAKTVPALVWHKLTLASGWINYNVVASHVPAYAIDVQGIVHLRGMVNNPNHDSFVFATLPTAARPPVSIYLAARIYTGSRDGLVRIDADGTMHALDTVYNADPGPQTSLDGLTYTIS